MKLTVSEVMTRSVVSINFNESVDEAFQLLLRHNISGLPVVDDEDRLVGVLSELDLLRLLYNSDTKRDKVSDYASNNVVSVTIDQMLPDVAEIFLSRPFRRLPVVDRDNKLIGVVSRRDLIRFIREVRMKVSGMLEQRRQIVSPV